MLEIKSVKIEKDEIVGCICDKCKTRISVVEIFGKYGQTQDAQDVLMVDEIKYPDGLHINYLAGYGTTFDNTLMTITLCTPCFHEIVMKNGGTIVEQ